MKFKTSRAMENSTSSRRASLAKRRRAFLECSTAFTEGVDIYEVAQLTVLGRNDTVVEYRAGIFKPERNASLSHLNEIFKLRLI